jgi:penicillin-binding protein 1A
VLEILRPYLSLDRLRTFRKPKGWLGWTALSLFVLLLAGIATGVWWVARYTLAVNRLSRGVGDTIFYGADSKPWFRLDEQRRDVPLNQIAADLQHAVVAVEDRRFYVHPGVDPIGLARAVVRDVRSRSLAEGGSTLTQQLARTLFLSNTQTFARKAKEALIAVLIELRLSKNEILELYLNRVYLSAGVYGVEAMSQHLYRKSSRNLTLSEAAFIAGLLRAPSALSPWSNYDGALERSHVVLSLMREQKFITPAQETAARGERPDIQPYRSPVDARAGWAKDYLRQQFRNQFGGDHPPDWRVQTGFIPALQEAAERAVASGVQRTGTRGDPPLQASLVAIDPRNGNIVAMVGGSNYKTSTFNRATRARRQAGSAFKPFVYAAALSNGFTPVTVLSNLDRVSAPRDPEWRPTNVTYRDSPDPTRVSLRAALTESNNAAAAQLQQQVGSGKVLRVASDAGLKDLPDVPSLALGVGLVTPLALTTAYTMFPEGGEVVEPRGIIEVLDADGTTVFAPAIARRRVVSDAVAFQTLSMLRDVVDRGTANGARAAGVTGPIGGKTGTTDDYHDAWFVGFSSSVVVGVWVGFDQPKPIGANAYGARVALPIWTDFMKRAASVLPAREFIVPASVEGEPLCSVSHLRPVDGCPVYTEYFKEGDDKPSQLCTVHRGSLKQVVVRTADKLLRGLGRAIGGLFRR